LKVLIGVSGSIAAYKSLILARELFKGGYSLRVILSRGALNFVTPLSFQELAGAKVFTDPDLFKGNTHVDLARWSEIFLVVPATYNLLGKVASGLADDLLTSTIAAHPSPVVFAPAMHTEMWENPILQRNIDALKEAGHVILPVKEGDLASGDRGKGRMLEPEEILRYLEDLRKAKDFWKGKRVVVTYGGTVEPIDDVRVITNLSSGKMGVALATWLSFFGAHVVAVACGSAPKAPAREFYRIKTARELFDLLKSMEYDYLFMAAAVSDYRPNYKPGKLKKDVSSLILNLQRNPDILSNLPKDRGKIVGFALEERENLRSEAVRKLKEKDVDFIVANPTDVIGKDRTEAFLFDRKGLLKQLSGTKWEVAAEIVKKLALE